jgi:hypothetical protein
MDQLVMTEHKTALSAKEYNVLLAQIAARIANAYIIKEAGSPAKDAVLVAKEIMERSGLVVAPPQQ